MYVYRLGVVGGYTEAPLTGYVLAAESEYVCVCVCIWLYVCIFMGVCVK